MLSDLQGRGNERRVWIGVGWLRGGSKACQTGAQLGRLQWGESVEKEESSMKTAASLVVY